MSLPSWIRRLRLGSLVSLSVVWVLLWGSLSWGTAVLAVVVAGIVLVAFPLPPTRARIRLRPISFLVLATKFLVNLTVASFQVGWKAIRPQPLLPGRILDIRLQDDDDLRRTIVAEMISLVPGTIVIDLNRATGILTLHVMDDCTDAQAEEQRARVHALERRVVRAFAPSEVEL